jgi:hypothetical protein
MSKKSAARAEETDAETQEDADLKAALDAEAAKLVKGPPIGLPVTYRRHEGPLQSRAPTPEEMAARAEENAKLLADDPAAKVLPVERGVAVYGPHRHEYHKTGDELAAIVVKVWGHDCVDLRVFDEPHDFKRTSASRGFGPGQWSELGVTE